MGRDGEVIAWIRRLTSSTVLVAVLLMSGLAAPSSAAQLDIVVNGPGTVVATIPDAGDSESSTVVCSTADNPEPFATEGCEAQYVPGRTVTLVAHPMSIDQRIFSFGRSSFEMWSDDRCPPERACDLPIDSDRQTVTASFAPQKVTVHMSDSPEGPGRVASSPAGLACEALLNARRQCVGFFPLLSTVQLIAEGAGASWRSGCDTVVGLTCTITTDELRLTQLLFPGGLLGGLGGGREVQFRVARDGSGSGTVQGPELDCGRVCSKVVRFGKRESFTAYPDAYSRFRRWRGACGDDARCTLTIGPVTRVTAVFEADPRRAQRRPTAAPSLPEPEAGPRAPDAPYVAVLGRRLLVRGARPRRIRFSLRVSARSLIRGVLETARGLRVKVETWQIQPGRRVLRLDVPGRARRGSYVVRITARDGLGHRERFTRRVRLPG